MRLAGVGAPATPMTSDRFETSPSLTPKMTARRVPERALRCQPSRWAIWSGDWAAPSDVGAWPDGSRASAAALPPGAGTGSPATAVPGVSPLRLPLQPPPDLGVLALVGGDRCDVGGITLRVVRVLLVAFERLDQLGDRLVPNIRARPMMRRTRARGRFQAGTLAPCSCRRTAQMSA